MITIKDVARRAGVTEKTAERALSGQTQGVRRDARERAERVLKAAQELGYYPSQIALSLRNGRTRTLGFVADRITDQYFAAAAEVAMDEAEHHGYSLILRLMRGDPEKGIECINRFRSSGVDGIIYGGALTEETHDFFAELNKQNYPLLTLDSPSSFPFSSVSSDHSDSIPEAVRYLAGRGHCKLLLGLYAGLDEFITATAAAFRESCAKYNIKATIKISHNFREVATLADKEPAALLLYGKYSTRVFLDEARRHDNYHPDLIGFYNEWTWAAAPHPQLCGVIFDCAEMQIRAAIRQLLAQLDDNAPLQNLKFLSRFIPAAEFDTLHTRNLSNEYLFPAENR